MLELARHECGIENPTCNTVMSPGLSRYLEMLIQSQWNVIYF